MEIKQKVADSDPSNANWQLLVAIGHTYRGEVLASLGRLNDADYAFHKSLESFRTCAARSGEFEVATILGNCLLPCWNSSPKCCNRAAVICQMTGSFTRRGRCELPAEHRNQREGWSLAILNQYGMAGRSGKSYIRIGEALTLQQRHSEAVTSFQHSLEAITKLRIAIPAMRDGFNTMVLLTPTWEIH